VQILVAVAVIQSNEDVSAQWLMTGVEKDSLPTAVAHGSAGRETNRKVVPNGDERILRLSNKNLANIPCRIIWYRLLLLRDTSTMWGGFLMQRTATIDPILLQDA